MEYTSGHRDQVKEKILQSARRLFNRRGFNAVSIDDVMGDAGLTRGSFYTYFKTKSDLYAEAVTSAVCEKRDANGDEPGREFSADQIVRDYLSTRHFEDIDGSCPMIGLPSDISRTSASVRKAFEAALRLMVEVFERGVETEGKLARDRALAVAAICVGGMVLARSVDDRRFADELREAAMSAALSLGKWTGPSG